VFALPAVYTIDTFGRRNLLLTTFPLMAAFLLLTGFAFFIDGVQGRVARKYFWRSNVLSFTAYFIVVATSIYLFGVCYSRKFE